MERFVRVGVAVGWRLLLGVCLALLGMGGASAARQHAAKLAIAAAGNPACPWMDPARSPDQRALELLRAMSIDDKVRMLGGTGLFSDTADTPPPTIGSFGYTPANVRLCIPSLVFTGAGAGIGDNQTAVTAFPDPVVQTATWDPSEQYAIGRAIGEEAAAKGGNVWIGGGVDIVRSPLDGRTFEYAGEDPYLAGRTIVGITQGAQSVPGVISTVKHYALNSQETDRGSQSGLNGTNDPTAEGPTVSENADERTMREIYLAPFEAGIVQGGAGAVMCSYNKVHGVYACSNPYLLTKVLKHDWGFKGFVLSDWGATHSTIQAANAGLDIEEYGNSYFGPPLKAAVQARQVPLSRLNDMVFRVASTMFRFGVFDHPKAPAAQAYSANASTPVHITTALRVAEDGSVLLKNKSNALPVAGTGKTIAVIGPAAGQQGAELAYQGEGSGHVPFVGVSNAVVSPLSAITQRAASAGDVVTYNDGSDAASAAAAAKAADIALVFAYDCETEAADRPDLGMHATTGNYFNGCGYSGDTSDQAALISAVAAANRRTVVVLDVGGPVVMPWINQVAGVLDMFYPGQVDGTAAAALLFGDVNPSGKLPETFPRREQDLPAKLAPLGDLQSNYTEKLLVGYRWYDQQGITPLFPFGFGLSYGTRYQYSHLAISPARIRPPAPSEIRLGHDVATVAFDVRNAGSRTGSEVPEVYVGFPASIAEPPKRLVGFAKQAIAPGQTVQFSIKLDARALAYWSSRRNGWAIAPGIYPICVGTSSSDLRLYSAVRVGNAGGPSTDACGQIAAPSAQVCLRTSYSVALRQLSSRIVRATVYVNGRRVKILRGRRLRKITISHLGKATSYRIQIVTTTKRRSSTSLTRLYRSCTNTDQSKWPAASGWLR